MRFLDTLDPWFLIAAGWFLLFVLEARFGHRDAYMQGKEDGYDLAAKHHRIATADEDVPPAFLKQLVNRKEERV